ncbi:MAG TPA: PEP-CTERM sorting domain-containing protein [Sedimentisphaerales bacterium]
MKQIIRMISVVAALSGFTIATQAQIVWSQNFDSLGLGAYGTTTDFVNDPTTPALPANNIVTSGSGQAMAFTFNALSGTTVNLQAATPTYAASGNTSANLANYTLSFDLAVQGVNLAMGYGGLEISVQNGGGIFGSHALFDFLTPAQAPLAGSGYQHFSYNLGTFSGSLNPSGAALAFGLGVIGYGNGMTANPETLLVDNVQITMVPEPSTFAMLLGGLGLLAGLCRYRRA